MSQRRTAATARKTPKQARAQATVTAILDATIQVFDREGPTAATTTRIADVAGVSIGTLYQYFADRDAIVDALQDREFERAMHMVQQALSSARGERAAPAVARAVVEGLLRLYAAAPGLHRLLVLEGLHVAPTERVRAFDMQVIAVIRSYLRSSGIRLRRANLDAAVFVIYQAVRAAMLARLFETPPELDDATLVEEITDLVLRYLVADSLAGT